MEISIIFKLKFDRFLSKGLAKRHSEMQQQSLEVVRMRKWKKVVPV